jgi:hypothetical protein
MPVDHRNLKTQGERGAYEAQGEQGVFHAQGE